MNENAKKWVAALRSGEFEQGRFRLQIAGEKYCCLGVACELYRRETGEGQWKQYNDYRHGECKMFSVPKEDECIAGLPHIVKDWLSLSSKTGTTDFNGSLTNKNDFGSTFDDLASLIESEPEGLFVKEGSTP